MVTPRSRCGGRRRRCRSRRRRSSSAGTAIRRPRLSVIQRMSAAPPRAASTDFSTAARSPSSTSTLISRGAWVTPIRTSTVRSVRASPLLRRRVWGRVSCRSPPLVIRLCRSTSREDFGPAAGGHRARPNDAKRVTTRRGGAEGVAVGLGGRGDDVERVGRRVQHAEHAAHHAAVDGAQHRVLDGDVAERAVIADDPQAVAGTTSGRRGRARSSGPRTRGR